MKAKIQPQRPAADVLANFQSYVFSHPVAKDTYGDLAAALGATSSPQIIILTGPTGVGKSTLAKAARNRLLHYYEKQMVEEPDFVPVVTINAVPPNGNTFNWKDFCVFQTKLDTHSTANWTAIPAQTGH